MTARDSKFTTRGIHEFLSRKYPPVEYLLDPILTRRGTAMIAGFRGRGKSFLALSAAYAIATGAKLLGWQAPNPTSVLYVDGEMDPADVQQRLSAIHKTLGSSAKREPTDETFRILSAQEHAFGIPDLADPVDDKGRRRIEAALGDCEVLFLDNLSTLCRTGVENDAESWGAMQEWLLGLRSQGKAVVILHHAGKEDKRGRATQRGTSKREDILTASLMLQKCGDDGFKVECTKLRSGRMFEPFAVALDYVAGKRCALSIGQSDEQMNVETAGFLKGQGHSQTDIAKQLGVNQSTVSRWLAQQGSSAQCEPV
jgi:hypothetical protein